MALARHDPRRNMADRIRAIMSAVRGYVVK